MKSLSRIILLFLIACTILLSACSGGETQTETQSLSGELVTSATEESATGRAAVADNLPQNLNLDGKSFTILTRPGTRMKDVDGGGEESGDIVYDAVYHRNVSVEERLNCKLPVVVCESSAWKDYATMMSSGILAGDDAWQVIFTTGNSAMQSGNDYLFRSVEKLKYLDFTMPWWRLDSMQELSYDGKHIRYMIGDIALNNYLRTAVVYFNKDLYENNFGDPDELYKTVIDRKWTWDKLREYAQKAYKDANGNGQQDEGDVFGLVFYSKDAAVQISYSCDVRLMSRDKDGYPMMDVDLERAANVLQKLIDVVYNTKGIDPTFSWEAADNTRLTKTFTSSHSLFMCTHLDNALGADLRDMEADFGIIPMPMYDEKQKDYTGLIHNSADNVVIPVTCKAPDDSAAVIEALAAESYRSVIDVFYDTAMKAKYSRDSYSGQCIDIVHDTTNRHWSYEYSSQVKNATLIYDCLFKQSTDIASAYSAMKSNAETSIANLVAQYKELDK